ncbi:MAG: hypothetical protein IKE70_06625, partial [Bacilli bacterium]|nr:hypothetical protein [Bacilli bacterium]
EDYRLIKKDLFNIYALLFNWLYVLYRKLYITGIIGLLIILILIYINPLYSLIFLGLSMILLGILFNKYYQLITKIKVSKIVKEKEGEDPFYVKELCKKNGGVNISICLIIYGIFLIASIFIFVKTQFIKPKRSFYFKETSENQANCISITRQSYLSFKSKINNLDAEEATCRVVVGNPKQFRMIIKISNNNSDYYVYYLADGQYLNYINDTRDINVLEEKEKSLLLNETEKNSLTEKRNIIEEYNDIIKRSKNEDELIKKGKETSAKNNFIITKEEMMR